MRKKPPGDLSIKNITVLFNHVTSLTFGTKQDILADEDTVLTAKKIASVLKHSGFKVSLFEVNEKTVQKLPTIKTDFFFNLCGGIGNLPNSEHEVVDILDRINIPYSGASSDKLLLTTNKVITKKYFNKYNIPTPSYQVFKSKDEKLKDGLTFPLIVKPIAEDCSFGIHSDSVVINSKQLRKKVEDVIRTYKEPALVEDYINTRELNVTIVGNGEQAKVLPISEIVFGKSYNQKKKWKIVDFAAKWLEDSVSYHDTVGICPSDLSASIKDRIEKYALKAYKKICGNPGYARFDIRLAEDNKIYFLEINLNPDISDGMGAARSAKAYGWNYPDFLHKIIEVSINRHSS
jgi:D-alanine-D-alanine ligase